MVVKIESYSNIIDNNRNMITDPIEISNHFNLNLSLWAQKLIQKFLPRNNITQEYLKNLRTNKTFFLRPVKQKEIYDNILSLDLNKFVGPNSLPIFIKKMCNEFLFNLTDQNPKYILSPRHFSRSSQTS